jgi:hypothetical protein
MSCRVSEALIAFQAAERTGYRWTVRLPKVPMLTVFLASTTGITIRAGLAVLVVIVVMVYVVARRRRG